MAVLTPDKIITIQKDLKIKQKIIPDSMIADKKIAQWIPKGAKVKPCQKLNNGTGKPRGICIHNTEALSVSGTTMSEQYSRATYNGNMGGVIVTFYVCDKEVWQILNEFEQGWHATDGSSRKEGYKGKLIGGNVDCISIEIVGNSQKAEENGAKLTGWLLDKYGLSIGDVYSHNFFYPPKKCPVYILPHWNDFIKTVQKWKSNNSASTNTSVSKPAEAKPASKLFCVRLGGFKDNKSAEEIRKKVVQKGFADAYIKIGTDKLRYVQIGAFSSEANAKDCCKKANAVGFSPVVVKE